MVTWLQKTEKFAMRSASARSSVRAVEGAVVSKPMATKTTRRSGSSIANFRASMGEYTTRTSAPAALASRKEPLPPGTRNISPKHANVTPGLVGDRDGIVNPAHGDHAYGATRAVDELHGLRKVVFEPVLVDGMRMAAAHLHELVVTAWLAQVGDGARQSGRFASVSVLGDKAHELLPLGR